MSKFENHPNYNCIITLDSGETYKVFGNWIRNENLDQWKGYSCDAGLTRFYIDKDFGIWSGDCKNDYLGNALEDWQPNPNTICRRETCTGCTDDLIVKKHDRSRI